MPRSPRPCLSALCPRCLLLLAVVTVGCQQKRDERIDLTRYVEVDPGQAIVGLLGPTAKMRVSVRNVSHLELKKLRLEVKSAACNATVAPASIARLIPGQRTFFQVALARRAEAQAKRHPLLLTLYAEGLPIPAGLDLLVDLRGHVDGEWIDVGQVKLVHRSSSRLSYYVLGALPLLVLLGWLLRRWAQRRRKSVSS